MKMTLLKIFLIIGLFKGISLNAQVNQSIPDKVNFVPNKETAIKIAEAIWLPIYGKIIYQEKPFKAVLIKKSIWVVSGTLKDPGKGNDILGGTAYIEIRKSDCKILRVTHGK